jgi:hypothetical protein
MEHVLWIGGPPGCGKTAIATRLVRRYGLRLYSSDTRTWRHRDRALRAGSLAALRWEALTPEERWQPDPSELLELSLHEQRGPMVVDDLRALPSSPLVVAEGSTLPAHSVPDPSRAVWLLPAADFQRATLLERGTPRGPLSLYLALGETIALEAREADVPVLTVDGSRGVDALAAEVAERFASALAAGPRAESPAERRVLVREANEAIALQVRDYHARPWADGDADEVVMEFLCECADPGCGASVPLPVGEASAAVLAPGHHC